MASSNEETSESEYIAEGLMGESNEMPSNVRHLDKAT